MQAPPKKMKKIKVPKVVNGVETEVEIEVEDVAGPSWGPNDAHRIINKPIPRVDGPQKVSGTAKYSYDVRLPGMLYGRILRSPHARAKVTKLDLAPAKRIPVPHPAAAAQAAAPTSTSARIIACGETLSRERIGHDGSAKQAPHILYTFLRS